MDDRKEPNSLFSLNEDEEQKTASEKEETENEKNNNIQGKAETADTEMVLYPVAPKARSQADDHVDVTISPAFQTLDQVCLLPFMVQSLYLIQQWNGGQGRQGHMPTSHVRRWGTKGTESLEGEPTKCLKVLFHAKL